MGRVSLEKRNKEMAVRKEKIKKETKKNNNIKKDRKEKISEKEKKKINKKVILSILISFVVIILLASICFVFFIPNVKLLGDRVITIKLNEDYKDKGIKATYQGKDITTEVKIKDNVDTDKVGTYKVTYKVKKGLFEVEKTRTVKVIDDIKPVIELIGEKEITICPGKKFDELGYIATDNYDGDITKNVKIEETEEKIVYIVSDSSGNKVTNKRNFIRKDEEGPVISLKGEQTIYIEQGGIYNEPGYIASDNCEGDMTASVVIDGNIDTSQVGSQTITYKTIDTKGNETTVNRTVYVKHPKVSVPNGIYKNSMIYLTFDDGPSNVTGAMLDVLKEKNVKATFFVINQSDSLNYLIKRAYDEGHTIALHSNTHKYNLIYSSVDNYFNDLYAISNKVKNITGVESKIIRFPGGGSNTTSRQYSLGIMSTLTNEVLAMGYHYFDWNVDCGDAGGAKNSTDVYNNVVNHLSHNQTNVVLMHDFANNYKTLEALDDIIDYGLANGYTFAAIDMNTPLVRHRVLN